MKTFPGFFLIFAVLRSGEPLRCEKCYKDGLTCSGTNRLCDYHLQTCVVVLVEYTHYGKPQLRAVKTCEHTNVCNTPLQYLNMGRGIYERSNVICCIGEACKTAAPRFQPGFITPNGKSCPACFATDISHCGSARVDCSGNEFHCISTFHEVWEHGWMCNPPLWLLGEITNCSVVLHLEPPDSYPQHSYLFFPKVNITAGDK
nr:phospholipase A2 inhibitor and Ly6/PLAUR domain-containing protein-like [Anolis sagrei ordinatus]